MLARHHFCGFFGPAIWGGIIGMMWPQITPWVGFPILFIGVLMSLYWFYGLLQESCADLKKLQKGALENAVATAKQMFRTFAEKNRGGQFEATAMQSLDESLVANLNTKMNTLKNLKTQWNFTNKKMQIAVGEAYLAYHKLIFGLRDIAKGKGYDVQTDPVFDTWKGWDKKLSVRLRLLTRG